MNRPSVTATTWAACLFFMCIAGCATTATDDNAPADLVISDRWSGDFPVARLNLLPDGQRRSRAGYIGDRQTFAAVWQAFKPGEKIPGVDFKQNLVIFSRNVDFYNRTRIMKAVLAGGDLEILAMETMSAMPIEDQAAMAMAVIPRAGVKFILAGDARVPVTDGR
jgi:hypothetical protein